MLDDLISMALGLTVVAREKVEDLTDYLVEKGELQREEARKIAHNLVEKGRTEKEIYIQKMQQGFDSLKEKLVTREDLERLEKRIDELYEMIRQDNNQG